jgi:protein phosphatase
MFEEFTRGNRNGFSLNPDVDVLKRFRHILTRCVGRGTEMHADVFNFQLTTDDVLLLRTDGLSNCFPDEKSILLLLDDDDPESVVETLVKFANQQGSSDNMTAIVIRMLDPEVSQCDSRVAQPEGWNAS